MDITIKVYKENHNALIDLINDLGFSNYHAHHYGHVEIEDATKADLEKVESAVLNSSLIEASITVFE